jgi:hypothetical protein
MSPSVRFTCMASREKRDEGFVCATQIPLDISIYGRSSNPSHPPVTRPNLLLGLYFRRNHDRIWNYATGSMERLGELGVDLMRKLLIDNGFR